MTSRTLPARGHRASRTSGAPLRLRRGGALRNRAAAGSIDFAKLVTMAMLEKLDPTIKHQMFAPADSFPSRTSNSRSIAIPTALVRGPRRALHPVELQARGPVADGHPARQQVRESGKKTPTS